MIVCFTGHRIMQPENIAETAQCLEIKLSELAQSNDVVICRAGGAIGFDTLAALSVLNIREKYENVKLHLILPCENQTKGWRDSDIEKYKYIRKNADSVRVLYPEYRQGCMHARNRELVKGSDLCIAYYDGKNTGGSAYTVKLAMKSNVEVWNCFV